MSKFFRRVVTSVHSFFTVAAVLSTWAFGLIVLMNGAVTSIVNVTGIVVLLCPT